MTMFNSKVLDYQRVLPTIHDISHISPINHHIFPRFPILLGQTDSPFRFPQPKMTDVDRSVAYACGAWRLAALAHSSLAMETEMAHTIYEERIFAYMNL